MRPEVFRVFCHLWRRADKDTGIAWPSVPTMAKTCRLEVKTVRHAIDELETAGLLTSHERAGRSTEYHLCLPTSQSDDSTEATPAVRLPGQPNGKGSQTAPHPVGQTVPHPGSQTAPHPYRLATHEGIPSKVLQVRQPSEGAAHSRAQEVEFPWSSHDDPALPAPVVAVLTTSFSDAKTRAEVFREIRDRKVTYNDRHTPEDWTSIVCTLVRRAAKTLSHQRPSSTSQATPEPTGWLEFLNSQFPDSIYSRGGTSEVTRWASLTRDVQGWLVAEMQKRSSAPATTATPDSSATPGP